MPVDAVYPGILHRGKGIRVKDYASSRLDVIVGSFSPTLWSWFIVVERAPQRFSSMAWEAIHFASDAA